LDNAQAGAYTLLLDPGGTDAGTVTVRADQVTDLPDATLMVGWEAVTSTFAAGQNRKMTFTATAGQRVKLSIPDATIGAALTLTAPDGTTPIDGRVHCTTLFRSLDNAQAGAYTLLLDPGGTDAGTLTVKAEAVSGDVSTSLKVDGDPVSVG